MAGHVKMPDEKQLINVKIVILANETRFVKILKQAWTLIAR